LINNETNPISDEDTDENDEETRELCEDYEELIAEGVKKPPKSGLHINNRAAERKEQIQLTLNISKFFDNIGGTLSDSQLERNIQSQDLDDDDFESVSQVNASKQPVWNVPDSDVESTAANTYIKRKTNVFDTNSSIISNKSKDMPQSPKLSPGKVSGVKAMTRSSTSKVRKEISTKKAKSLINKDITKASVDKNTRRASSQVG